MATTTDIPNIDKAAIVLYSLPPASSEVVLRLLGDQYAGQLRDLMDWYSKSPDLDELMQQVIREFDELQRSLGKGSFQSFLSDDREKRAAYQYALSEQVNEDQASDEPDPLELSDDPQDTLSNAGISVLAAALANEHPRAIAVILHGLEIEKSAEVLKRLPDEKRRETFVMMAKGVPTNDAMVTRIRSAVAELCVEKGQSGEDSEEDSIFKTLAEILHQVERDERNIMMEGLEALDPDIHHQVDELLYDFEDLIKIEDRSLQKILSELDQKVLATALQDATDDLMECVMSNMSERMRGMLREEMEFLGKVPKDKLEKARRDVTDVVRNHDREGSLVWKT